ncbi:MAG: 30S ribosomal protein S12 methylthiotransferase RimO [Bacteroidota bacterium]
MEYFPRISLITLGCSKNLVDSEFLLNRLKSNGYSVNHEDVKKGDILIINTCGFINDAKQESIETILNYAEQKKIGNVEKLIVMGCLSQRYRDELKEEIPEVDHFFGVDELPDIIEYLKGSNNSYNQHRRFLSKPNHYSFLKIAEGCNRKCAFCSIPFIRGSYKSKSIETLRSEATYLSQDGVKELNVIAQDLSYYGYDRYKEYLLPKLLEELVKMNSFPWIRLLYNYPSQFPTRVLEIMKYYPSICNYLDIPFQHISDPVLKKMRRGISTKDTNNLIDLIKSELPNTTLRTTLMVGHPGEGEKEFIELLNFVKNTEFDRLGVFTYSEEEGTYAARQYENQVPENIKQERADEIMKIQQSISRNKNKEKIGLSSYVLIDSEDEHYFYGRTEADAPEVDNNILIDKSDGGSNKIAIGEFFRIKITAAYDYDLLGVLE